ncbi:MAG: hypothetical protein K0S20_407 [Patescibacteria group bacterium]|jgi:uncharacterized membrane protein|nr:hypothetical protein [Patescibacteria group bacterium]
MSKMLIAAFNDRAAADMAIADLETAGYSAKDLSVISKQQDKVVETDGAGDRAAEGALSGAATGGAIGGVAGLLAGAGIVPALTGLLIGGPIAAALGATGIAAATISGAVTGAVAGGLIGALTNLGLPEDTARYYETTVNEGGLVLAVPVREGEATDARDILENNHASQINTVELPA